MDSNDLRAFVAFADALNFTHAARVVHLSQPALFACVKRLAGQVDVPLYERRGRALVLTAAGERLAAHGRDVLDAERSLLAQVRGDAADATCALAIGEGALLHVVAEQVASFAREHPQRLRVMIADGPSAVALVKNGTANVAVVANAAIDDDDLVAKPVLRSAVVAVGALHSSQPISLPELATLPLILPARGRPLRESIEAAFASRGLTARVAVEASGWNAMLMLARLGCGVAFVNDVVTLPRGLHARVVDGLAPVTYRAMTRRRRSQLATELLRALTS